MSGPRLDAVSARAAADFVAPELGRTPRERLRAVLDNLDSEGFISMAKVLDLTATGESDVARLTSLRKLRREVAKAAETAGQSFDFVVDSDKRADPADRRCWFTGESPTRRQLADLSRAEARGDARERTIPPEMAQVVPAPAVRVYVSYQASSERDRKSAEDFIDRLASALKSVERVIRPVGASRPGRDPCVGGLSGRPARTHQ